MKLILVAVLSLSIVFGSDCHVGEIQMFFGPYSGIPDGFQLCDGTNDTPDMRDRFPVGAYNYFPFGTEGGNSAAGDITLTVQNIPAHDHDLKDVTVTYEGKHDHNWFVSGTIRIDDHIHGLGTISVDDHTFDHSHRVNGYTDEQENHDHGVDLETNSAGDHYHGEGDLDTKNAGTHYHPVDEEKTSIADAHGHDIQGYFDCVADPNGPIASIIDEDIDHFHKVPEHETKLAGAHHHDIVGETGNAGGHNHSVEGDTDKDGSHNHKVYGKSDIIQITLVHDFSGNSAPGGGREYGFKTADGTIFKAGEHSHKVDGKTGIKGQGKSFNALPPFRSVYFICCVSTQPSKKPTEKPTPKPKGKHPKGKYSKAAWINEMSDNQNKYVAEDRTYTYHFTINVSFTNLIVGVGVFFIGCINGIIIYCWYRNQMIVRQEE